MASLRAYVQSWLPASHPGLEVQDNLIEQGLDSLHIMRMVSQWRKTGLALTFAALIEQPSLQAWLALIQHAAQQPSLPALATVSMATADRQTPFDLTDVQYSYWVGRGDEQWLGGVGCHAYLEIDGQWLNAERLNQAWHTLLVHHPMLRARFTAEGQQWIPDTVAPPQLEINDLQALDLQACEHALGLVRNRLSHRRLDVTQGQVMGLTLSLLPDGHCRLHLDIDLLVADVQSLNIVLRDLARAYSGKDLSSNPDWHFGHYLRHERQQSSNSQAMAYWHARLDNLPLGPSLPTCTTAEQTPPTFIRRQMTLSPEQWSHLRQQAASLRVTPAMTLAAIYAEVLARWSHDSHFVLNVPLFDRNTAHAGIEEVVADFTNLLLLECDCRTPASFAQRVIRLQQQFHQDVAHASYSAVRVQRDLARVRHTEGVVAPVVFACNLGTPLLDPATQATLGCLHHMISQTPQVWLDHQIYELDQGLLLAWDSVDSLFPEGLIDDMFAAYSQLITALANPHTNWHAPLTLPLPSAQQQARNQVNHSYHEYRPRTLHLPIFQQAVQHPERIALHAPEQDVSYGQLADQAHRIARLLIDAGVQPTDRVAVSMPRGVGQVAAVLGVLAAGGCYVPVSPTQPLARQARIHATASIRHALVADLPLMPVPDCQYLTLDQASQCAPLTTPLAVSPEQLAYIIFTSGSTGEPKGVEVTHQAATNTLDALQRRYAISSADCGLAVSALDFDLSVYDIFGLLGVGGRLVVLDEAERRDALRWSQAVQRHQVTLWNSVPVLLDMLLIASQGTLLPLRHAMVSGDWIGLDLPERLAQATQGQAQLIAMGGATEAAIWSNVFDVTLPLPAHWVSIPYGYPLDNQCYRVVDPLGMDCPDWVAGELWIGGTGLARGYCADPALTAQKFVTDAQGQRWYRTGDRGRYWPGGVLEFLGRQDHQVKVRGHRIELGEIESALIKLPGVTRAVALTLGQPPVLAAALQVSEALTVAEVQAGLRQWVPEYMMPSQWLLLEALPLSGNGKVDRKQLQDLLAAQGAMQELEGEAPLPGVEASVAAIWQQVLKLESIHRHDSFFALGGDSLLATQVVAALRQEGLEADQPLRWLFAQPVLAGFAAGLRQSESRQCVRQIEPAPQVRHLPFPLTEVQRAYWMGQSPGLPLNCGTHYLVELDGSELDLARLGKAWDQLVARHEMLRAEVLADGQQRIRSELPPVSLQTLEVPEHASAEMAQACLHAQWIMRRHMSVLEHAPLQHIYVAPYAGTRYRIGVFFNYLTLDGFSIKLILQQWAQIYTASTQAWPALTLSFRDYVNQVQPDEQAMARAQAYWRERLADLPPAPALPLARDPASLEAPEFCRRSMRLSASNWTTLRARCREHNLTPSILLLFAYSQILAQWSGNRPLTVNLTLFDRQPAHPEVMDIAGDFTSLTPVVCQPASALPVLTQLQQLQDTLASALEHRECSSIWVQRERARTLGPQAAALPVVFTSTLGMGDGLFEHTPPGFPEFVSGGLSETPQVWLDHQLYEFNGELELSWDAVDALFPDGMLDAMFTAYRTLLEQLQESNWHAPLTLPLPSAQQQARNQVNHSHHEYRPRTLHLPIFQQAVQHPERIALHAPEQDVSYGQLADQAHRIARLLIDAGVQPTDRVAVSMPRGVGQVAAVLGVLAAGGCYVPVSPTQPLARQARIHATASIRHALVADLPLTPVPDCQYLTLDQASQCAPLTTPLAVSPEQLAYIIFTSGSTGEPKGVEVTHQAATNTLDALQRRYAISSADCGLAVSALDFDLSVYDIFGLLGVGGRLVVLDEAERRDALRWSQAVQRHQVTLWNSVPVLLDMLLIASQGTLLPLRHAMVSGDWIGLDLPERLAQATQGQAQLIAMGGATEAAIWSNVFDVTLPLPAHWVSIPYGYPLDNQCYRVVDPLGMDCPDWVAGELWIGGTGLAQGYCADPALTAQKFVTDAQGQRWYRTGDRGRYWPGGVLEFLGRQDHQVKVRGHRIELGEIESALIKLPGVTRAVALTLGQPPVLAAALQVSEALTVAEVQAGLRQWVPEYMLPSQWLLLEALPLSGNGKVDRKQLQDLLAAQGAMQELEGEAPLPGVEASVAAIWQQVLKLESIHRHDSFFALGGDSLLATQVVAALRQEGLEADQPLRWLFAQPVLAGFAAGLRQSESRQCVRQIEPAPQVRHLPFPLTEVQRAYWMGQSPGLPLNCGTHYLVELDGSELDLARLGKAWDQLVARHEMLRAEVLADGQQRIRSELPPVIIQVSQHDSLPQAQAYIQQRWQAMANAPTDTATCHMYACYYAQRCRLAVVLDYMMLDGFSIKLLLNEWASLYQQPEMMWPALTLSFRDYVSQVQPDEQAMARAQAYWRERLADLPPAPALPLARDPATLKHPVFSRRTITLPAPHWQALRESAPREGLTPSMLVLLVYAEVLSRWSGNQAITLNMTVFDRPPVHAEMTRIVGDFTSLVPVAYQPAETASTLSQAHALQQTVADALEHRECSSIWVQREQARHSGLTSAALPVVFTSTLGMADDLFDQPVSGFPELVSGGVSETPQVWLDHQMYEHRGALLISWDAVDALFPEGVLDAMFASLSDTLMQWQAHDWHAPLTLPLPSAQQQARNQVNHSHHEYRPRTLHLPIFQQAVQHPERIALHAPEQDVSYGQLADQAHRIARLLIDAGVQPTDRVAVSMPRGVGQVAAVLGVLAAGGCYVPVSPTQPLARQARIHATASIRHALVADLPLMPVPDCQYLTLDQASQCAPLTTPLAVSPEQLAYIIFTSGSTGEPKGVEVTHQAATNTLDALQRRYAISSADCGLAVSALDFDLSVYDIFGLLGVGGRLVVLDEAERRDALRWSQAVQRHQVTLWNSVPVLLDMLLIASQGTLLPLRHAMVSGDWIGLDLPERLAQATQGQAQLIAMGGATEAAIWSNVFDVTLPLPAHWVSIPYGYPLDNQCYRVVDPLGMDCPDWVAGELWIGGTGLAQGYCADPALTAQKFVTDAQGQRWYRTGDRGRYWPGGVLEFLGRQDHQVKVRGHRIELGEIESALIKLPGVTRAVALTLGQPPVLAAALQVSEALTVAEVQAGLRQWVPEYMLPSQWLLLEALPLSGNGKVDRKQLQDLLAAQGAMQELEGEAPCDALEQQVAEVWQRVLSVSAPFRDDDFFLKGGDSLTATRLVQLLHTERISPLPIPLRTLFSASTLAALSEVIREQWQSLGGDKRQLSDACTVYEEGSV
ncbi:hypothetical protein BXU06_11805 [Aquaspirillum sp. LM1]|nr:hypothetical protein BXU06_11805 [Aquaspirillum sp. LM1]